MLAPAVHRSTYAAPVLPEEELATYVLADAGRWPDRPALVDGVTGNALTYGDLATGIAATATALAGRGVGVGTAVALSAANQPAWAVAFYGALAAGATVVPLNPALTPEELRGALTRSRPAVMVTDAHLPPCTAVAAELAVHELLLADLVPAAPPTAAAGPAAPVPAAPAPRTPDPARTAVIGHSSGTGGLPKGVRLTHRNLVATLAQHEPIYHLGPDDVLLAALPFFHIYGMSIVLGYALRHGATVVTMPRFDRDRYLALIAAHRVTWLHLVPPLALALVRPEAAGADFSSVRHAVSGAAPLDPDLATRAAHVLGCPIGQGYGMTEASPGVTWVPDDGSVPCPPGSVGVLVPGTEARLVDPTTGADAEGAGELWVRGPQVMAGYVDDPEATAAALTPDGWLRTGDVLRVDDAGVWWVVDRLKELIKFKGWHVAPAELEAVLLGHPAVADAAVAGVPDPEAGEVPVAWVVAPKAAGVTGTATAAELLDWVADRVAPYKKVRRLHLVDRIPRSASGKVLRRLLAEPTAGTATAPSPSDDMEPRDPKEER